MKGQTGTIQDFEGERASGIASLTVKHEDGTTQLIYCDNAATVRALDSLFGNVIGNDDTVNVEAIKGKKIVYRLDECGVLAWINEQVHLPKPRHSRQHQVRELRRNGKKHKKTVG